MEQLRRERYLNLITFRKDGSPVRTPIWFIHVGNKLGFYTKRDSYKVKRLRRNPQLQVAACNVRGRVHGPWLSGSAELVDADTARAAEVYAGLRRKYGWQAWLLLSGGRLLGRAQAWQVVEVTLATAEAESPLG